MKIIICLFLLILSQFSIISISLRGDKKRRDLTGDNIGINLYNSQVTTQTMKRPQKWFFNVMVHKPNEKYFREAEYNGLRYQTEMLKDNLEREYNDYVRDYYEEKLNVHEQKMINTNIEMKKRENK